MKTISLWMVLLVWGVFLCSCKDKETTSSEKRILEFTINDVKGKVNETGKTVSVSLPEGTDYVLIPTIKISELATVSPESEEAVDFTNPVTYTVMAEDGSQQPYQITVTMDNKDNTALVITSLDPGSSLCSGDKGLVILGRNFSDNPKVELGTVAVTILEKSDTEISIAFDLSKYFISGRPASSSINLKVTGNGQSVTRQITLTDLCK